MSHDPDVPIPGSRAILNRVAPVEDPGSEAGYPTRPVPRPAVGSESHAWVAEAAVPVKAGVRGGPPTVLVHKLAVVDLVQPSAPEYGRGLRTRDASTLSPLSLGRAVQQWHRSGGGLSSVAVVSARRRRH